MVSSSSLPNGEWKSTTSGILVVDEQGTPFITVSTQGFNVDGEVWHPDPSGFLIGKVVRTIPDANISLIQLANGTRYINQCVTSSEPGVSVQSGLISGYPPHLKHYDRVTMKSPSDSVEGLVLAQGIKIKVSRKIVEHQWLYMNLDTDLADRAHGSPILADDNRTIVGFLRQGQKDPKHYYTVSAAALWDAGYEIRGHEVEF